MYTCTGVQVHVCMYTHVCTGVPTTINRTYMYKKMEGIASNSQIALLQAPHR